MKNISVGSLPWRVTYDNAKDEVFVANSGSNNVSVVSDSSNTVVTTVDVGTQPDGMAYDSGKGEVFVSNQGSNTVSVINDTTNIVVATVAVGSGPDGVAYDSSKGEIFVADGDSSAVSVMNDTTNTVIATVGIGMWPAGVVYDGSKGEIFVANTGSYNASVISDTSNSVVATIPVGSYPHGVAYDSGKGEVLVANYGSNNMSVINDTTNSVVASVPVGSNPDSVACDSVKGEVFVTNVASNTVSVINDQDRTVGATVSVGSSPFGIAYDTREGEVFVAVPNSNIVSFFPTDPSVALNPSSSTVMVGQTIWVNATVTGGFAPYTFKWNTTSNHAGCSVATTSPSAMCTPTLPGIAFALKVDVTDFFGATENATSSNITVSLVHAALSVSRGEVDVNENLTLTARVTEDLATLLYGYSFPGMAGCAPSTSASIVCTPTAIGNFSVEMRVTDAYGNSWNATSATVQVYPALRVNLTVSSPTPLLAQTVAIVANASGGSPAYNYAYLGLPYGCYSENKSSIGCLPTQSDWYNITVVVTDINNGTARATVAMHVIFDFNVVAPSSTTVGLAMTISVNTNQTFSGPTDLAMPAGGVEALTYGYSGLPPGCASKDTPRITCTPTTVGTYSVTVSVRDQAGDHNTHTVAVHVTEGLLGLAGYEGYVVIGVVVAVVAVAVAVLLLRKRRSPPAAKALPKEEPESKEPEKGEAEKSPEKTATSEGTSPGTEKSG